MPRADTLTTSIYELLVNEEDARACADIPERACRETPRNFVLILITHFLTKVGDAISSPKTVLSWVLASVQAPPFLVGFLVPVRESGSLIPQLFIGGWVRRLALRKHVWVAGAVCQAVAIAGMALVIITLEGAAAGWSLIGLLTLFSLARGLSSVASKDVLGKTVPKRRRGQLTGWSASAAGLVILGVGAFLLMPGIQEPDNATFAILLAAAAALWILAAAIFGLIEEYPGETDGGKNGFVDALRRVSLLVEDQPFRRFVIARSLLLCSALSAPYYVLLTRENVGSQSFLLGLFVIAGGLAQLISAPLWGQFSDRSSRRVMATAGALSAAVGVVVFFTASVLPDVLAHVAFLPLAYFALSVAHSGVRVGRKTYVVDLAGGNRRTDYVTVSNSVIGVVLLIAGTTGALTSLIGTAGVILVLSSMGFAGATLSIGLPEVQDGAA